MDIFGTVITAGTLILDFVGACAAYSNDAKSLKARFEWDLRALSTIRQYFQQRKDQNDNQELSAEDVALLNQTAHYLDTLVGKVHQSLYKIRRKGFLNGIINRGMWIARQADLKELEREIYAWTQRFDVRVLGLPSELRAIIPSSSSDIEPPALIKSNNDLKTFLKFASIAKDQKGADMRLQDSKDLAKRIIDRGDHCFLPLQEGERQLIFASRRVSQKLAPGTAIFKDIDSEMGLLAAALNCLSPAADLRLLKVECYFFHEETNQFIFTQVAPFPIVSAMTLELTIKYDSFPEAEALLDHRFKLALKLAESVFFLHTAGFVHKNITTSSIVVLQRPDSPLSLEDFYLMGFELIRGVDGRTDDKKSTPVTTHEEVRPIWEYDIFQHPDRLPWSSSQRYTKTHDVYSLGVALLQVGLWETLDKALPDLKEDKPSSWPNELHTAAMKLGPRVGAKYQRVVSWCLGLDGNTVVREDEFLEQVLEPLEEVVNALS